jgi:O-antigen/teichoic acid export membrane protein
MLKKIKSFLFENQTIRQTVVKNTFWLAVSNIGGRLLRAIIIIYAARVLGAKGWGVFSYAVTLAAFFTVFVDIGINNIVMREIARVRDIAKRSEILSTSLWLKIILLAIGVFIIIFLAPRFTTIQAAKKILPIIALILAFDTLREFGSSLIRGVEKMEIETGLFILTNIAIIAFGFLLLWLSPTVVSFTFSYAIGTGVGAIATLFVIKKYVRGLLSSFSGRLIKFIITSAWPFAISGVLGMLMLNADILILGWLRSAQEVGFYSAANRIIQLLYVLPSVLALSVLPTFSRLADKDNPKMRFVVERVLSLVFLAALPMAAGGVILGKPIITLIFGGGYASGAIPFQILMATLIIDYSAVTLSQAIFSYNRQKNLIVYSAIGGITNIALDLIFIPKFGMIGCAGATLIAQLLSNIYLWRTMKTINNFHILPYLKKIFIATIAMSIVSFSFLFLGLNVLVIIGSSILVYFGCLYLLKEPVLKEVKVLLQSHIFTQEKPAPVTLPF